MQSTEGWKDRTWWIFVSSGFLKLVLGKEREMMIGKKRQERGDMGELTGCTLGEETWI